MFMFAVRTNAMVKNVLAIVLLMFRREHSEALPVLLLAQIDTSNKICFSQ